MSLKENYEAFVTSCRFYRVEKTEYENLKQQKLDPVSKQTMLFYERDIRFVEHWFEIISEKCGTNAALLMWLLFVEERTQNDISEMFGISRSNLWTKLENWKKELFDDNSVKKYNLMKVGALNDI